MLSVCKHYTNFFWPVDGCLPTPKLFPPCLQSAGLKCQSLHAGCQNTKWSTGPDTSKRSGPCGTVPGKHAVQQSGLRRDRFTSEAFSQWPVSFALAWQALLSPSICWSWRKSLPLYHFLTSSVEKLPEKKERNSSRGLAKLEPVYPSFLLRRQTQRQSCRWQSTLVLVSQVGLPSRPFPSSESLSLTNSNSFSPPPPPTHFFFLISSNENNEFLRPTRMWQGVKRGSREGDVWPRQLP